MPSYNGINIFGVAVTMATAPRERPKWLQPAFGADGLPCLDGGGRGGETIVSGVLTGASAAGLSAAEALFRSMQDGQSRDLVDTFGVVWPEVLLDHFEPQGRVRQSAYGAFWRGYKARFIHLV